MSVRSVFAVALVATAVLSGCKEQTPIPHTPAVIKIVSGANQSGDLSAALDSALVVQVLDAGSKSVSGIALTWTVSGGGSVSAATTTTDGDGKSTVKWTLAPTAGNQVVTVTSTQIVGVSVSFVANNGAMITGTVAINSSQSPFAPTLSVAPKASLASASARATGPQLPLYSRDRIVVGFKSGVLGVEAASSMAYRTMSTARGTASRIQDRVTSLGAKLPISHAEISPALVAARIRVDDPSRIDEVIASLQQDSSVAYVERDAFRRVDGPRSGRVTTSARMRSLVSMAMQTPTGALGVATRLPNDPLFLYQYWNYNMIGLPRAWGITTGSSSVTVAVLDMGVRFDDAGVAGNLSTDGYDFVSAIGSGYTADGTLSLCTGGVVATINGDGDGPDADPTDPDDLEQDPDTGCWSHSSIGDHGLWTASIIGELGNNGSAGTGINWTVKIRPVRVLGITGEGTDFDIAQGILYAAGLPATGAGGVAVQTTRAPIINMSLGGYGSSTTERNAVAAAVAAGSLIIASAGNDAVDVPSFPASYPNVMSIAAVGPDGNMASYSNAGSSISVAAPGGDYRLDATNADNGGDWVWGRWWDFTQNRSVFAAAVGTSAAAPHVSGVAALILSQNPGMTATVLRQRIEQYATRPVGANRNNNTGWGIVNAYNSLTQQSGPPTQTYVRLIDATTGNVVKTSAVGVGGNFAMTRLAVGSYYLQAGDDESSDATIGVPGRRFGWAGGFGTPTLFTVTAGKSIQAAAILLGIPNESEPNDDVAHANALSVGSYVTGSIITPDVRDVYSVIIPVAGTYTFETSGVLGSCGFGLELGTFLSVANSTGTVVGSNDDFSSPTSAFCSRVRSTLAVGTYYVTVSGSSSGGQSSHGRYRLEVRAGT